MLGVDGKRHYNGTVQMAERLDQPTAELPALELSSWSGPVYGDTLFHGPDFQVIKKLDGVSEQGMVAELSGIRGQGWETAGWRTDAAAMDGGLQLALLWSKHVLGGNSLPTAVGASAPGRASCRRGPSAAF